MGPSLGQCWDLDLGQRLSTEDVSHWHPLPSVKMMSLSDHRLPARIFWGAFKNTDSLTPLQAQEMQSEVCKFCLKN